MNQFSNNKIFFYPEYIKEILKGTITKPIVYEVSLSGLCNCHCSYCCCKAFNNCDSLSLDDIDIIVNELKLNNAKAITITGGGEPLENNLFTYAIKKFSNAGFSVGVITNGLLMTKKSAEEIVKNTKFCRISLDSVNILEYKKIRGTVPELKKLCNDLKYLVYEKRRLNSDILIGAQIVYVNQSTYSIENTLKFCKYCGIDFVQVRPVDNISGEYIQRDYKFYNNSKKQLYTLCNKYSDDTFSVIINANKFDEYYNQKVYKSYDTCLGGNLSAAIGHDMNVYYCCANIGNPLFSLGNLRKEKLDNILCSNKRKELVYSPNFSLCQVQCRNHKINIILDELDKLSQNTVEIIIKDKNKESVPLHCEFL